MLRTLFLLIFFLVLGEPSVAQQESFNRVVFQYEEKMQQAATSWVKKNHTRALDGFYAAREWLSENMPSAMNDYEWAGWQAMKTYSVVLARFVEGDLYRREGRFDMVDRVSEQALEWAENLKEQADAWSKVRARTPTEESMREKWVGRFRSAIRQAQKFSSNGTDEN